MMNTDTDIMDHVSAQNIIDYLKETGSSVTFNLEVPAHFLLRLEHLGCELELTTFEEVLTTLAQQVHSTR